MHVSSVWENKGAIDTLSFVTAESARTQDLTDLVLYRYCKKFKGDVGVWKPAGMKKLDRKGLSREAEDTLVQLQDAQRLSRDATPLCQAEEILQKYPEEKEGHLDSVTARLMQNCGDFREEQLVASERLHIGLFRGIFFEFYQDEGDFGRERA